MDYRKYISSKGFKIIAFGIIFLCFAMKCRKTGDIEYYITNKSNQVLVFKQLVFKDKNSNDTITTFIYPNDFERFVGKLTNTEPSPRKLKSCPCGKPTFSLSVLDSNFSLLKDPDNANNWNKSLVKGKFTKSPDYTKCFFEVNQSDIQ